MARLEEKFKQRVARRPNNKPLEELETKQDVLTEIPLYQIVPDPNQPRRDLGNLTELKASMTAVGLAQPILVTILGYEQYMLVAGERRYTAAKELGWKKISCIVRTIEQNQRLALQIIENLHRKDLNALEEAEGYQRLMDEFGMTQEEVGLHLGKSQVSINEALRVLALPDTIRSQYRTSDRVSKSLLLEIAKTTSQMEQENLWEAARQGQLTVKQARAVKKASASQASKQPSTTAPITFRYPIQTQEAHIVITFQRSNATSEEIITTLEEALESEKMRRASTFASL